MFRRDRAMFVAVLCTASAACAPAAAAAPDTGGASMPALIPASTGGAGYGDPGSASLVVGPVAVMGTDVIARGTMPRGARRTVILQRLDRR